MTHATQNNPVAADSDIAANHKSAIKKYEFPYRIPIEDLAKAYTSPEEAFAAGDYLYVARFGRNNLELWGCALLMLGNRVGGERILDDNNVITARACLYRAYAAWQESDDVVARRWIEEGRRTGEDPHFDRFESLMRRTSFRVLFYHDYHTEHFIEVFRSLPGIEITMVQHLTWPLDQPLDSAIPADKPLDLVLLDDVKLMPLGVGDSGAPVVALIHDIECNYESLDRVLPEVDLICTAASSEVLEVGRAFGVRASVGFFPLHMNLPESGRLSGMLDDASSRTTDIFYSGSIGQDGYYYKKQQVLSLAGLSENFGVEIKEEFLLVHELWQKMQSTRFSIMSGRYCNYAATRAIEAVANGALQLTEDDDGMPYLFSEKFDCFAIYRRDHIVVDVERHLNNYDQIVARFRRQLPQFEKEFNSLLPRDPKIRAMRFLRHALFMTHVETDSRSKRKLKPKSARDMIYISEYDHFVFRTEAAAQYIGQLHHPHWLRRAFGVKALAMAQKKSDRAMLEDFRQALLEGVAACPDSLALHHVLGLCQWYLGMQSEAEQSFTKITSGDLHLMPDDPSPIDLGRLNSLYWVNDARVRARCPKDTRPLVSVGDVWCSYAWAYRAQGARLRGEIKNAVAYAAHSLELFPYNVDVQKIYLRNVFGLAESGSKEWGDCFLEAFDAACHNDRTVLHDFAVPAFHILTTHGEIEKAFELLGQLKLYLSRVKLAPWQYALYREFYPYIQRYGIPHTAVPNS